MILGLELLPSVGGSVGGIVLLVIGLAAAIGYFKRQTQEIWRSTAEGWKVENEANKERADRLATELDRTASELKDSRHRTDITVVLEHLQRQHKEATAILTRIADESSERNGHMVDILTVHMAEENQVWERVSQVITDTYKTVAELHALAPYTGKSS